MKCIKYLIFLCLLITSLSKAQVSVFGKVDHIIPDGVDTQGNITLTVSGSTAPYTYTWNPGAISTKDINNITAGQYTVNVKSASNQTYTAIYSLGYKTLWTNLNKAIFRNDSLLVGSGTALYSTSCSKNTLAANTDGWFEYVISYIGASNSYIGFSDSLSAAYERINDIDFGFWLRGTDLDLYSFQNGTTQLIKSSPKVGDVVRLQRVGDVITYKVNNVAVKTVTVSGISQKTFKLRTAFNGSHRFINVGCSFNKLDSTFFQNYVKMLPLIKHESSIGASDGSIKLTPAIPFANTYSWQPGGATTNSVTSLTYNTYSVSVKDSLMNSSHHRYSVGYKVFWTNVDRAYFRNDSLVATNSSNGLYGSAHSKNTLRPNTDGWFEYIITGLGSSDYYVGFADSLSANSGNNYTDIDYGFFYDGSVKYLYYYENGTIDDIYVSLNVGDRLRIQRIGNVITYKLNDVTLRSLTVSGISQKSLKLKASLSSTNRLTNVGCSFINLDSSTVKNYVKVIPIVKHSSAPGISDGSITIKPRIQFSNTYSWTPGGATTNSITSLLPGTYTVTVSDSLQNKTTHQCNVGYKVLWTNLDRCALSNDTLTSSALDGVFSTACSKNTLVGNTDGWFEFVIDKLGGSYNYYIGFTDSLSPVAGNYRELDYGIYYYPASKYLYAYENGTQTALFLTPQIGDVVRVERTGNTIRYKLNNITLRAVTVADIGAKTFKLKADIEGSDRLVNIGCSFYDIDSIAFKNYIQLTPLIKHGTTAVSSDGSIKVTPKIAGTYTYSWQPGATTTNTIGLLSPGGVNTVTVTDNSGNQSSSQYAVGYKAIWTNTTTAFFRNDSLKSTAPNSSSYGYACTKNILPANTDGWFEYVISTLQNYNTYIGFTDSASNNSSIFTDILYGFYYYGPSKYLYSYESGTTTGIYLSPRAGDVVRIERVGNSIFYKVNGATLRTITNSSIGPKVLKVKARLAYTNSLVHVGISVPPCNTNISAGISPTLTCSSPTAVLSGTSTTSGVTYSWNPGGTTPTSYSTSVSAAGTYTLRITNTASCAVEATVSVITNTVAPTVVIESSSPTPTLGLNAYWPFTGNADDKSGNGNNGTVTSAGLTTDRFGNPNRAYEFNGTTSRIDVPNSATVDMPNGQDYSISFWMKSKSGNVDAIPISKNEYGAWSGYMFFTNSTNGGYCNTPGHGSFYLAAGGGGDACSDIPFCNDTTSWYFITGQYNATTNQVFMYVNGVLQSDVGTASGPTSNTKPLSFGSYNDGAGIGYYKGALDDIRMYNRMLNQDEIDALYHESNPLANVMTCAAPSLNLIAISPTPGLSYSWTPGGSSPTSSVTTITNGGTYSLSVTNTVTGCTSSNSVSVIFNFCTSVDIENYVNDTTKGQVNFTIGGGTPPYEVVWNGAKIPSNSSVLALMALYTGTATTIDTVKIKHDLDSLRTLSNYTNLQPGVYPFDIYDQVNDSINAMAVVGTKITWATSKSVSMQDQSVKPRYHNGKMYVYGNAVKVTQSGAFYPDSSFAVAANHIADDYSNYVEFVYPDSTYICKVGFQKDTAAIESLSDKCYFEFNGMDSVKIHFLDSVIYNGSTNTGDLYAMANDTSTGNITFYRNGTLLVSREYSRLNPSAGLLFKVAMGSAASKINSIIMITSSVYTSDYVMGTVKDVSCGSNCSGSIDAKGVIANGAFAVKPVKYELEDLSNPGVIVSTIHYPGGINHALFQNLCPGNYRVTYHAIAVYNLLGVIISLPVTATGDFEIAYMPDWGNAANVSIDPNDHSLTKNAGASALFTWDAGASSLNKLSHLKNGWIEWTGYASNIFSPNYGVIGIGFTSSLQNPASVDIATINYGVGVLGVFSSWVKVNNQLIISALMTPPVTQGSFMTNDIFRLEKNGTTVTLKINGNLTPYSVTIPSGTDLVADASIQFLSNQIKHPRVSFGCPYVEEYTLLKKKLDGGYYTTHDQKLLFKYDEEYADVDGKLTFNIYDKYNKVVMNNTSMPSGSQPASVYGDNRYSIDIGNTSYYVTGQTMPSNNYYILEVINEKNEKWYLRFKK